MAGDAGFLFLGYDDDFSLVSLISADGFDWSPLDGGDFHGLDRLASWDGRYLRAGTVGDGSELRAAFWVSDDGRSWEALPSTAALAFLADGAPRSPFYAFVFHHEAAGDLITATGVVLASGSEFGDDPLALVRWVSEDGGQTWSRHELEAKFRNRVAPIRIGDVWVRIDAYGEYLETSTDNKGWQPTVDTPGYETWGHVRLTPFGAVAVGWLEVVDMPPYGLVVNSTDGVTWIQSTGSPALEGALLRDVAGTASALVAIGSVVNYAPNPQAPTQVWVSHGTAD